MMMIWILVCMRSTTRWSECIIRTSRKFRWLLWVSFFGFTYRLCRIQSFSSATTSLSDLVWASIESSMFLFSAVVVKIFCMTGGKESPLEDELSDEDLRLGFLSESKRVCSVWILIVNEWCVGIAPYLRVNLHDDNICPCMWLNVSVLFILSFKCLFFLLELLLVSIFQLHYVRCPIRMLIYISSTSWHPLLILFLRRVIFSQFLCLTTFLRAFKASR